MVRFFYPGSLLFSHWTGVWLKPNMTQSLKTHFLNYLCFCFDSALAFIVFKRWEVTFIAITDPFLEFISVWHTFMALEGGHIVSNCRQDSSNSFLSRFLLIKTWSFLSSGVFHVCWASHSYARCHELGMRLFALEYGCFIYSINYFEGAVLSNGCWKAEKWTW